MRTDTISILDGSTFVVSNRAGHRRGTRPGPRAFLKDTRHLSRWILEVDGKAPDVLSTDDIEYYYAQFFLAPKTGTIYKNPYLSVIRRRLVGDGFVEDIAVLNHGGAPAEVSLRLRVSSDFADLFEVKDALEKKGTLYREMREEQIVLGYRREDFVRETRIATDAPAEIDAEGLLFRLRVEPRSEWHTRIAVQPVLGDQVIVPKYVKGRQSRSRSCARDWRDGWGTLRASPASPMPCGASTGAAWSISRRCDSRRTSCRAPRFRRRDCRGSWRCSAGTAS